MAAHGDRVYRPDSSHPLENPKHDWSEPG
jgi:hypothetical protein